MAGLLYIKRLLTLKTEPLIIPGQAKMIQGSAWPKPVYAGLVLIFYIGLALLMAGCLWREPALPGNFATPADSRLILHLPYYSEGRGAYSQAAFAALMTFHGHPLSMEEAERRFGQRRISARAMAAQARKSGLLAAYYSGTPEELVAAVRNEKPLIVCLGAEAGPLKAGDYVVVAGYTQSGVVVNSTNINQQIVDWPAFLTGWFKASNFMLKIEPF